jgi:hypothetical protein
MTVEYSHGSEMEWMIQGERRIVAVQFPIVKMVLMMCLALVQTRGMMPASSHAHN